MSSKPVRFQWTDDGHMVPHPRAAPLCDKQFVIGEWYTLVVHEERSHASHAHYFASITEAWNNLSPEQAARWPSVEHLRQWALCQAGYVNERVIPAPSGKQARVIALMARSLAEFAVITIKKLPEPYFDDELNLRVTHVVTIWTAKSQSHSAMDKKQFAESKEAVLRVVSELIGTDAATLNANAGRAA